jgi:DNA-binding transcriptional MerR regulator
VYYLDMPPESSNLTIDDLVFAVHATLNASPVEELNGRIRAVPDVRTLRYYTTLGLLDRPARMEGRTAFYGRRHVLQLVAIKRLQGRGFSLAEIQARLLNASDADLRRVAELPADFQPHASHVSHSQPTRSEPLATADEPLTLGAPREPDRVFWKARPSAVAAAPPTAIASEQSPSLLLGVPLEAAASLLFQAARPLDEEDLSAIRTAAAPLVDVLRQRGLLS